jgi:outer membrane protein OmpA-like peptidoglycan-associated protein/opacity protein-like surface antigen
MRLAARCMATMAFAFVLAPALCADDTTQPKAKAKKDEAPASVIALSAVTKGQPTPAKTSPAGSSTTPTSPVAAYVQPVPPMHSWDESENSFPKVEWFLGYSFWRAMPTSSNNRMGYLHGGSTSIAYNFNRYVGLVADFAGFDNSKLTLFGPAGTETVDSNGSAYTFMFGPRFSYRKHERFTPFFQVLAGGVHASSVSISGCSGDPSCTPLGSENTFAAMIGTGFDIKLSRHIALRLFEGDFLLTHFKDPFSASGDQVWQKNARFSTGIVFRFGGNPPPPPSLPIGATCSADREFVYVGSGDIVAVRAQVSNPGNNPLNYSWSASEGSVDGTGPEVRWNSSERRLGTYTVTLRVDNGRNGSAACSVSIRVERRPNRPPTMSCSANHPVVTVGDSVEITAVASDPDNDPLTYTWNASAGRVEGSGPSVTFQTANLSPGSYTVTGHVDDGRTGTADCAVNVEVQAPQPPPEVKELETRLSLHSIYFPTARPTVANPGGGLVESQQKVLLLLASDFNRYLTFKPQARLILEGHADRRGAVEYNKELTERRVERTKSFLVEHGVPDANIETRALGKEENLDAAQVKRLVDQNPDLTDDERQRIEANLDVIVLANNRRVDVSLNTTGQQSVRQYPFNAKDSLTLLSPRGGDTEGRAKPPTKKKPTTP